MRLFMIVNEAVAISLMALAVSNLDSKEFQLEAATFQLEEKVKEAQKAEVSGHAAKRLLSVTCDAVVRLRQASHQSLRTYRVSVYSRNYI